MGRGRRGKKTSKKEQKTTKKTSTEIRNENKKKGWNEKKGDVKIKQQSENGKKVGSEKKDDKKIKKQSKQNVALSKSEYVYLDKIFSNPNDYGSLSGPNIMYNVVKEKNERNLSHNQIKHYFAMKDSYTTSRKRINKLNEPPYITHFKYEIIQTDLLFMTKYANDNDSTFYLLTCIDAFSKFAYVRGLKDKTSKTVCDAFKSILDEINSPILSCTYDLGSEFKTKVWHKLMNDYNINYFPTTTGHLAIIERFHKTLKSKLTKHMIENNTHRYIDRLQNIVQSYNNTKHSSINCKPSEVNRTNQYKIFKYLNKNLWKLPKAKEYAFNLKDSVRISLNRTIYDRESTERFSREIYTIVHRYRRSNVNTYKLMDCSKEILVGNFYEPELVLVIEDKNKMHPIEKILKKTKTKALVKFENFPKKCSEWVDIKSIKNI